MTTCPTCRVNPEGAPSIGRTPRGGVFVFRACQACQREVDREVARLLTRRFGLDALLGPKTA